MSTKTTLFSAMYGETQNASLLNLELWRDTVQQELDHPTNKSIGWTHRDIKLQTRLSALTTLIEKRGEYRVRDGVPSGVRIGEWEQLGFPE